MHLANAEGGNRTLTPLRGQDFESCASASSATSAIGVIIGDFGGDVNGQIVVSYDEGAGCQQTA
jgi:hypothetical protein